MPKQSSIKKVLVIGSGPIIIGQGAEFDYSGTQACKVLREEGIEVVLLNNNPATIMTDPSAADHVYMEPLLPEIVEKIIVKEKPDAIIAGMGGQTALNLVLALETQGMLKRYGIRVIGTSTKSIEQAENREAFKALMAEINEPCVPSEIVTRVEEAIAAAKHLGYPVVVRPAYTLGGTGGGIAEDESELRAIAIKGFGYAVNGQVLIEKCIRGWKEIEYEMMRDAAGNVIVVCNMENVDPVGIHTGDSIVVAPSQTLSDHEYQMLRSASIRIVEALKIEGGCNVQIALEPNSLEYSVIEVNPRVSRSSALASKATGYPIAKVAAKIAIGYTLPEIMNDVTGSTSACFEPTLDYCVVKFPKFPFDKFKTADKRLGTMMMATGEVMAIGNSFEAAFMKALRSLESEQFTLRLDYAKKMVLDELFEACKQPEDMRIFCVAELLRRQVSAHVIANLTGIDYFFVMKLKSLVVLEQSIEGRDYKSIEPELLKTLKQKGFSDQGIAELSLFGTQTDIRKMRLALGIKCVYKMVDTCGAEFKSESPYYYSTYDLEDELKISEREKVLVIGSGPIRIGQGVEFDYCTVRGVSALKDLGYETIVINNNPETVSTDFNISDQLFFEPITIEDVLNVIEAENPIGVILQFGGQTALKLASRLDALGVTILGTTYEALHKAEDRDEFSKLAAEIGVICPPGQAVSAMEDGLALAKTMGFPLVVRPSYVLGGLGMRIVENEKEVVTYLNNAFLLEGVETVLIDRYLQGIECEIDGVCDGKDILIPGIMEHLEGAGVHSGDSMAVYPPRRITDKQKAEIVDIAKRLVTSLGVIGLFNIQFVIHQDQIYVIEVNPRSSRTNPFISKVTGAALLDIAIKVIMGQKLKALGYGVGLMAEREKYYFKLPVFSNAKILNMDVRLGPEMKSTGELLSVDACYHHGLYKGLLALTPSFKNINHVYLDCAPKHLKSLTKILKKAAGLKWITEENTCLAQSNFSDQMEVLTQSEAEFKIRSGEIQFVASLFDSYDHEVPAHKRIRRAAAESRGLCVTSMDTFDHIISCIEKPIHMDDLQVYDMVGDMHAPL